MAKQVSNIFINLGIKNAEGLDKLKSAFRELDKAVGPTSKSIDSAIAAVKRFSDSNSRSEQLIRGQIEAFKGLRSQVDVGGNRYAALTNEIGKLQAELRGSTDALERQREKLLRTASAGNQNAKSLQNQITGLERLRQQTRPGSSAFDQLTKDIDKASTSLGKFKSIASQAAQVATQAIGASFEKAGRQVQALQADLQTLNFSSAEFLKRQREINQILNQQASSVGRQNVRANAAIYTNPEYLTYMERRGRNLPLPATPAGYQQRIGEINAELENISNLERRRELTLELDKLNRQLKGTIIDATSAEQRAVDVVRARVNTQREVLGRSGFGAFSAGVTGRNFKAEQQQQIVADVKTAFASIEQARDTMDESVRAATRRTTQLELNAAQLIEESDQRFHAARMKRKQQEFETEVKAFDILLQSRNIESVIERRKRTLQGEIGIPTTRELSPFYESVVGLGTALPRRSQQFMGRAPQQVLGDIMYQASAGKILDPVNQDLKTFNTLSDLSTSSIGELSSALGKLKTELRPIDAGYKQLNASIERNEKIIEDTLRKRGNAQRQRLGGQQLAQIAGASISGGIFGGPEGLIGGIAGGILGGVGGSFAGAAAGAQVGMARQQLGGTAEYAAQIGKLQIALRGVAGTQDNYNQAINAAAAATRDLNVPQMEAIQGITRLSAAVLGAGGTIGDANFAFRAISESIKATGGNAEQVDGAMLALTQVFSKGKVSAEELNQIAERLPGTFTLFAQATGKSGPELQKALQQGQVGLNDLMKFLELASSKYGQTALGIAASSEEAGARTKIAFDQMRLEVGKALQPIGAELQTSFANFAKDITPLAKGLAEALAFFVKNDAAAGLAKFALNLGLVTAGFVALRAAIGYVQSLNISAWFATTATNAKITGDVMATSAANATRFSAASQGLFTALSQLAALGVVTVGINYIQTRVKEAMDINALAERESEGGAARQFQGATRETVLAAQEAQRRNLYRLQRQEEKFQQNLQNNQLLYQIPGLNAVMAQTSMEEQLRRGFESRFAQGVLSLDPNKFPKASVGETFPTAPIAADTEKTGAARLANETQRLNESIAQQEIRLADKVFDHKQELARRRYELEKELLDLETQNRLERMGSVEREAASIFEQQRQRDLQYADKLAQANDEVAKAAQAITSAQRMAAVTGGTTRAGLPAGMTGYITGDPSSPYYQADHGGANYHEHAAFADRATAEAAYKILTNAGIRVTEFLGRGQVGGHTPGSAHYSGLAFDVPASQVPPGQQAGLTARVKRLLGIGGVGGGALQRRATADQGDVGAAQLDYAQAVERRRLLEENQAAFTAASRETAALALSRAFREQNQELEKSIKNETIRAELQRSGYSEAYVKLQLELNDALELRNKRASQVPLDQPGALAEINTAYERRIELLKQTYELEQNLANSLGFREGAQRYVESIGTLREATAGLAQQGFKGIEDAIVSLATTGTANFAQFATSLLNDMARIIIQQFVVKQLTQAIMGLFGGGGGGGLGNYGVNLGMGFNQLPSFPMGSALPNFAGFAGMAKGGVLSANGIVPYAKGGVVTRPMLFPFANGGAIGTGLMGEAGPEAIMPLQRGPNGKLGVMAAGGGTTNVVVNVDATGGSSVQGDEDRANQLGKAVSAAVQAELVKQKRPGGLLAG